MKTLQLSEVIDTAIMLIKSNGSTTNLDIKKALRSAGYYVTQQIVSDIMDNLYAVNNLEFTNNGRYREYFTAATGSNVTSPVVVSSVSSSKTPKTPIPAVEVGLPSKGDWYVFDAKDHDDFKYYAAGPSRGIVRSAFHKISRVDYLDTRAKKIK
jgi:hypothetical protein